MHAAAFAESSLPMHQYSSCGNTSSTAVITTCYLGAMLLLNGTNILSPGLSCTAAGADATATAACGAATAA
eukprot:9740-Heterococcus_DN1.PRE.1